MYDDVQRLGEEKCKYTVGKIYTAQSMIPHEAGL